MACAIFRCASTTTASFISSRPKKAAPRLPRWMPSRRSRAEFANVASSRRCQVVLPLSAITGCCRRTDFPEGTMNVIPNASAAASIDRLLAELRPKLHRYCARMVGSAIDGEDVVQDALLKAVMSFPAAGPIGNPEGWLFRVAHNTALDFLRRRNRQQGVRSGEEVDMIADPADTIESRQAAAASLRTFMRLPVAQRSSVILMDVLGCSLHEICSVMEFSLPAVKAALHRGRARLSELADEPEELPRPVLSAADRIR